MSLLTPPHTTHRRAKDKENRDADPSFHVAWSEINKIHVVPLAGSPTKSGSRVPAPKNVPRKSILKKSSAVFSPWPEEKQRDMTPEPADPLVNLNYLTYPVETIVRATDATELRVLIEAYSILTNRLRASVTNNKAVDATWPLFQPLRNHRDTFTDAVIRDLGRALLDPNHRENEGVSALRVLLPSPTNTPKKKKRDGMSAEQAKYARDLCTTSHTVIRLLTLVFTIPCLIDLFTSLQLQSMLTAVLAIPLADELPTPNARKTWALAISLIQTQRLSVEVLSPAADRITLALCRGIDGELGKEGKKGSASDGLKAFHDLSIHLPSVFIPRFTDTLLLSVLASLLAPTLALRTQAAHAIGGFVIGLTSLPTSPIHTKVSRIVAGFVTKPSSPKLPSLSLTSSPTKSPIKPISQDPLIIRTLRTTLQATDVNNVAQGPVWGICVLSALLVLLGTTAIKIAPLRSLAQLGLRHKNRSVRALTSVMWRCIVWVFTQPTAPTGYESDGEDEVDAEGDEDEEVAVKREEQEKKQRNEWWRLIASVTEFEAGVGSIVATIGSVNPGVPSYVPPRYKYVEEEEEEKPLWRALELLLTMVCKDAPTRASAIDTMKALVCVPISSTETSSDTAVGRRSLLPKSLFSASPGLLTTSFATLKTAVNPIFEELPRAEDVKPLTPKEVGCDWVWDELVKAWKVAVGGAEGALQGEEREKEKGDLLEVWEGLVGMGLAAVLETGRDVDPDRETRNYYDSEAVAQFTMRTIDVIENDILEDAHLRLSSSSSSNMLSQRGISIPGFTTTPSDAIAKLAFAQELWRTVCRIVPQSMLGNAAERLIECLMRNTDEYTTFTGSVASTQELGFGVREEEEEGANLLNTTWTEFCLEVLAVCGSESVRAFWGFCEISEESDGKTETLWTCRWTTAERAFVWRLFTKGWMEQVSMAGWEGAVCVLAVPFVRSESRDKADDSTWILNQDDTELWQKLLEHSVATALDYGYDANMVLSAIVSLVLNDSYMPTHIRLVEFLFGHLASIAQVGDLREFPDSVLEFAAKTMMTAYPPSQDQTTYSWTARAAMLLFDRCPKELVGLLGENMAESVALWVGDAEKRWDSGVLEYDILPLYQTILVTIQGLPLSSDTLQTFGSILCAPFTTDAPAQTRGPSVDSFREFWDSTYASFDDIPREGWSEEIVSCLEAVYGIPEDSSLVKMDSSSAEPAERTPEPCPVVGQRPTTPPVSTEPSTSTPCTPTSPRVYKHPPTLTRVPMIHPRRSSRAFADLTLNSPESPMRKSRISNPLSPPRTSLSTSPTKRRRLGDKENASPNRVGTVSSVPEGLLSSPSFYTEKPILGKRKFAEEVIDSEDERNAVEDHLMAPPSSSDDDVFLAGPGLAKIQLMEPMLQRKRKRMFLDAVEVPLLSQVYNRRSSSFVSTGSGSANHALNATMPTSTPRLDLRLISKMQPRRVQSDTIGWQQAGSENKRRRFAQSPNEEKATARTPPVLDLGLPSGSSTRRAYRPLLPKLEPSPPLLFSSSSDDDIRTRIGQLTPHHLISPELKLKAGNGNRAGARLGLGSDTVDPPSSDDSVVVLSSPSTDLVKRRLRRHGSL